VEVLFRRALRHLKKEKGQSLVEMAIVLPILLLLFCGIVDFGWIMANQLIADNGSREGARLGSVVATKADYGSQVSNRILAVTPGYSHSGIGIFTVLTSPSNPSSGDIKVTITYTFHLLTPMAQMILGKKSYTATSTSIMKVE
jgi:Flp pilus assembly protein TadG